MAQWFFTKIRLFTITPNLPSSSTAQVNVLLLPSLLLFTTGPWTRDGMEDEIGLIGTGS